MLRPDKFKRLNKAKLRERACTMHIDGDPFTRCKAGFIQTPLCGGRIKTSCHFCGSFNQRMTPDCMKDDLPDWRMPHD